MLTDTAIKSAIKDCDSETVLNDRADGRGTGSLKLVIRRTSNGVSALWYATWQQDGKPRKKSLGRYPDVSLKGAREKMDDEIRPVLAEKKNPKAAAPMTDKPTVKRLFAGYVASLRENGRTSADEVERALLTGRYNAADGLGATRMAGSIDAADVSEYLGRAYRRGSRVMADRTRAYLSAAFNWGIECTNDYTAENRQDWGIKANPASMVKRDTRANKTRERNLTDTEMRTLWQGMDGKGYDPETTAAVRLIMTCGQRARETLRAEGVEIDLDGALWHMPAHKTKGGKRPHTIPLPRQAVEIFRELIEWHGEGPLFPSRDGSKLPHMTDGGVSRALRRFIDASGMRDFQLRDLRRTWKSRTADAGIDRFTRDLIQQHAKGDTGSKHYDMADYLPQMRAAMDKWEAWLDANVVKKQQMKAAA